MDNHIIIANLKSEPMGKLTNRVPGLLLLISSLPGLGFENVFRIARQNVIFTLLVIKLVLISVPTIYLSYCYNLIATHKILETRPWGPQKR